MIFTDSKVKNAINGAKKIMISRFEDYYSKSSENYSKYSKIYFWTNENIDAYLKLANFNNKENALSVLASGDHVFNLISKGITNIDTFDSNILTYYFALGLKRAMILKYNYYDYIKYMGKLGQNNVTSPEETYAIIRGLYNYMEQSHKMFWESLINYDFKLRKNSSKSWYNLIELLLMNDTDIHIDLYNTYLLNEENYNLLKCRLINANINFKNANAKNINQEFNNKYDFILLSNILDYFQYIFCDYWTYKNLKKYEEKLNSLTKEGAIIFLKYAFFYKYSGETEKPNHSERLFRYSGFRLTDLEDEEIHEINKPYSDAKDAIVLKRVK